MKASILFCTVGALLVVLANSHPPAPQKGRIVCYFESWAFNRPGIGRYSTEDIPGKLCTHVVYSFVGLNDIRWELQVLDPKLDLDMNSYMNFTELKFKFPGLKTLLALGGWAEGGHKYSQMVSKPERRCSVIRSVVDLMHEYSFDGLDIDWEYPGAVDRNGTSEDKNNFYFFVNEMRAAFDEENKAWELTMAIPLQETIVRNGYHLPELCQLIDAVHVMAYDMRSSYGKADTHSPLYRRPHDEAPDENYNVHDGMHLLEHLGCPSHKLVLGVPFYGRSFTLKDTSNFDLGSPAIGGGNPGKYTNERSFLAYYEICLAFRNEAGWKIHWDQFGLVPYAYKDNQWIGYENLESVQYKMNFIKKNGYAGAMTWAIDMDDFTGVCGTKNPLLTILNKNMKGYIVPTHHRNLARIRPESEAPPEPPSNICEVRTLKE